MLLLVALGVGAGIYLWQRPLAGPAVAAPGKPAAVNEASLPPGETVASLQKQIILLEGQVEYLEGQVQALQDDNAQLIQKMGTLGMKGGAQGAPPPAPGDEPPAADYVSLGVELLSLRKLRDVPVVAAPASQAEVEQMILAWLRRRDPGGASQRFTRALAALGAIPEPVDLLPLRAAMLARQLGGWYDEPSDTLLIIEKQVQPDQPPAAIDATLAFAYGHLLRDFQGSLFPVTGVQSSTDAQLAREALIGGDAALTRFLYSLQKPVAPGVGDLPPEDPDHPFNEVPMPVFLRELHSFAFSRGFEFAQALHSAGDFRQLSAAYGRAPKSTTEVMDPEAYLAAEPLPLVKVAWPEVAVAGAQPTWDDSLGRFAALAMLKAGNPDEVAYDATKNWRADRLLSFAAGEGTAAGRDHAVWQTLWADATGARAFFKALRTSLLQRYRQPPPAADDGTTAAVGFQAAGRFVSLVLNQQGAGVLFIDAGSADFLEAATARFDHPPATK